MITKQHHGFEKYEVKLKEVSNEISKILRDNFIGFYISGSSTMGVWDPQKSDIDFMVITKNPLNEKESADIKKLHETLAESDLGKKLEGDYVDLELLQQKTFEKITHSVKNGEFTTYVPCPISADNILCLIQYGRCIQGEPIEKLSLSVTDAELSGAVYSMLIEDIQEIDETDDFQTLYYILINSLRCIYTLATKRLPTKQDAIEYNKNLAGNDLYQNIMDIQNGKTSEFKIDKDKLKSIIDYGLSLKDWGQ